MIRPGLDHDETRKRLASGSDQLAEGQRNSVASRYETEGKVMEAGIQQAQNPADKALRGLHSPTRIEPRTKSLAQ